MLNSVEIITKLVFDHRNIVDFVSNSPSLVTFSKIGEPDKGTIIEWIKISFMFYV